MSNPITQFRECMLKPDFWKIAIKILHHPPTSRQALKMLTDLAQYDDVRREILQSSGIVHTLLTMLKSGATNIDRWEVGFKGLLALGLF
ncbi:hypothetical protein FB451DRAFT_1407744 [Mycena latifolia]|nr:hypothetical protein FB451DRAFT_1407744 [Mycena latifolia]